MHAPAKTSKKKCLPSTTLETEVASVQNQATPTIKFTALLSSQLIILVTKPLLLDLSSTSAAIMASAERCKRAATMKTLEAWPLGKESCFLYEKAGLVFML